MKGSTSDGSGLYLYKQPCETSACRSIARASYCFMCIGRTFSVSARIKALIFTKQHLEQRKQFALSGLFDHTDVHRAVVSMSKEGD